jgi:hypothetical protein
VNLASALLSLSHPFRFSFLFPYPFDAVAKLEKPSCCNPSTYCARASDGSIGCCAWGSTCAPVLGGAGTAPPQSTWRPTTWQQPATQISTVYATQTHPYVVGGQDSQPQTTTVYGGLIGQGQGQQGQQQYCSTLYAHGPNLPTTEAGTCGTILIANAATPGVGGKRWMVLGVWLLGMVVGGIV